MGTIKNRKEQLAEIRKDVLDDLMKIGDMAEVVDMLRECNRDPDKIGDYLFKWHDDRNRRIRRLQARIKNLVKQKLMTRRFARQAAGKLHKLVKLMEELQSIGMDFCGMME